MEGGAGDDVYVVDHTSDKVLERSNQGGIDRVEASVQRMNSLINDLPALDSADAAMRNQAWTDLLLNIGLVLLHVAGALKHHFIDRDGLLARMGFR